MNRSLLFAVLLLLLNACGQSPQNARGSASNEPGQDASDTIEAPAGPDFYKRYSGSLGGEPIVLHLVRYGKTVEGIYYFRGSGLGIRLRSQSDSAQSENQFQLDEIGREPILAQHGDDARWNLKVDGDAASGIWHSKHGTDTRSIALREDYPSGSVHLYAFSSSDSAALWPGRPHTPQAECSFNYLLPAGGRNSFLANALKEQLLPEQAHNPEPVPALVQSAMEAYFADYRKENEHLDLPGKDRLEALTFSYTDDRSVYVHYNDDDWLVTELFNASYTGGAHGFFASSFANIDLAQKRIWTLGDIISDTAALRPLLDDAAIRYFGATSGMPIDQRLLVDDIPATENIHVGPKGLSFVYVPYEIAPYAEGQISLYLSYSKLFPLLTPAFRERMKLGMRSGTALLIPHKNVRSHGKLRHNRIAALPHRSLHAADRL